MTGGPRRWLPGAVVVLAVAAMAIGSRPDGPLDPGQGDGVWRTARAGVALAAVIVLVVVAANFTKFRDDGYGLLRRAGSATAVLLTVAAVATPIGLLYFGRPPDKPPQQQQIPDAPATTLPTGRPPSGLPQPSGHTAKSYSDWIGKGLLYVLMAAVSALIVYLLFRLLSRRWFTRREIPLIDFDPLAPEAEQLAEAIAAGTEALEYQGDAREAVIACYAAMEQAVSADGGGRRATDTPEEFLRRVTAAQLIPESPARRLTELFREARFSRHPIAEEQRDAAREALRTIAEHLRVRAEALAATAAAQAQAAQLAQAAQAGGTSASASGRAR